ncbi:MAG: cupin domain-containing protein [Candidatus Omnitrophica bacterium]|nr:cupin domain-containing protein [Candidatus Omnitrophota bacterium]
MIIRKLNDCRQFISGDKAVLRELLHADKGSFKFRYSLAHARVNPGGVTLPHKLKTTEVYYILEGRGVMHIGAESRKVGAHYAIYVPPKKLQYIENKGNTDLVFLCIVDPAWNAEDEKILKK